MSIRKIKSEDQLIRFVWSRKAEYDYFLLLETQARNPFSFKNQKPVWKEAANALREGDLKMKVTDRSTRDRVNELLKKHRKEEADIKWSTGATDDETTEMKKLLANVNEMSLTKPNDAHSTIYLKKNRKDGESIRDAVLDEISDTDSDDYINKPHKQSSGRSGGGGDEMTLQEEIAYAESLQHAEDQSSDQPNSCEDAPSHSSDHRFSVPEADLQSINEDAVNGSVCVDAIDSSGNDGRKKSTQGPSVSTLSKLKDKNTSPTHKKLSSSNENASTSNSRFSNPKKDLINFLDRKSQKDMDLRKEETRIREMEVVNKREELQILRLKTETEAEERKRSLDLEAEPKKEELRILRLKTEADLEERKKTQDLMIRLLTKNN